MRCGKATFADAKCEASGALSPWREVVRPWSLAATLMLAGKASRIAIAECGFRIADLGADSGPVLVAGSFALAMRAAIGAGVRSFERRGTLVHSKCALTDAL